MNYLNILVTFLVVLFIYIHIQFQLSHSSERETYVLDIPVTIPIEEIFELKQPVIMHLYEQGVLSLLSKNILCEDLPKFDMSVYDNTRELTHAHILSSTKATKDLFYNDKESKYYTERNHGFINNLAPNSPFKDIIYRHRLLEPPLCSRKTYDIMFGSNNAVTSTQYSIMYRNIFTVTKGKLHVKMMHPDIAQEHKIFVKPNYTDMSFFTEEKVDLWGDKYHETIELQVKEGDTLSIPPYWLYSFRYEDETFVVCSQFNSYMTEIATFQHTSLYWITKFTRPSRAVHIQKQKQTSEEISEEQREPTSVNNTGDDNEQKPNNPISEQADKPVETNQPIKNAHSETVPSDVSVPEPDIDFNINNANKTKTEKNTTAI